MSIRITQVSCSLDKKITIFGFELVDLIVIFVSLSLLNFIFGQTSLGLAFVWIPTACIALILKFSKKGKPENFLLHLIRFHASPGVYSAFTPCEKILPSLPVNEVKKYA